MNPLRLETLYENIYNFYCDIVGFSVFTSCYCFNSFMTTRFIFISFITIRVSLTIRAGVVIILYWVSLGNPEYVIEYFYFIFTLAIVHFYSFSLMVSSYIKGGDCQIMGKCKETKNFIYFRLTIVVIFHVYSLLIFILSYICVFLSFDMCFYTKNSYLN